MAWDIWLRGRSALVYAVVGIMATVVLMYLSLYRSGWTVETEAMLHYFVYRVALLVFVPAVCSAVGAARRYYTQPLSAAQIALWLWLPAILAAPCMYLWVAVGFNLWTGSNWPLFGPALFCAMATAGALALLWSTAGLDLLRVLAFAGLALAVLGWLNVQDEYPLPPSVPNGAWIAEPALLAEWKPIGNPQTFFMLLAIAVSYPVGATSIRLDRSSQLPWDRLPSLQDLWLQLVGTLSRSRKRHTSAWKAQVWREWREKGYVGPLVFAGFFACLLGSYCIGWSSARSFVGGVATAGYWLVLLFGVLGLSFGRSGGTVRNPRCSVFLGTLPLSDKAVSYAMLRSAFASVVVTWLLWIAAMFAAMWMVGSNNMEPTWEVLQALTSISDIVPGESRSSAALATLIALAAMWTVVGTVASVVMAGRGWFLALVYAFTLVLLIAYVGGRAWLMDHGYPEIADRLEIGAFAAIVLLPVLAYVLALARRVIGRKELLFAAGLWLAMVALLEIGLRTPGGFQPIVYRADFVYPLIALVPLFPLAAAPLAMSWNRHR
jgi:hypothetical protein